MEIKNKPTPSIETKNKQVLFAVRLNFSIECVLLVLVGFLFGQPYFHSYYNLQWPIIVVVGLEAIAAHIAIKKRQHWSLVVLFVLMIVHLALLCMFLKVVVEQIYLNGFYEQLIFELLHTVIGIGLLVFVLSKLRAISCWIKGTDKPEPVAHFQYNGSPYPTGPSNSTFSTTHNAHAANGSLYPSEPNCSVATVGSTRPAYPSTAHSEVPSQPNHPYHSELACPSYPTVVDAPYDTKNTPYPAEETHPSYPTSVANPAVYPSLDTQVPIQNRDLTVHPAP